MKKKLFALILAVILLLPLLALASCSAAKDNVGNFAPAPEKESPEAGMGNDKLTSTNTSTGNVAERKIIKTYELNAETKEFDATVASISALVAEHGGYVESNSISNRNYNTKVARYASYKFRIPAESADAFVGSIGNTLNITRSNSYVEDVSESYYSIEATLEELQTERDSLLAMMESLDTQKDYSFWLTLQTRISDIRQQIARLQAQLNNYDSRVEYSTVSLYVNEVVEYTPAEEEGFWAKLGGAFVNGWTAFGSFMQGFMIVIVTIFPFLILPGAVVAIIIVSVHRKRAKKKAQKTAAEQDMTAE